MLHLQLAWRAAEIKALTYILLSTIYRYVAFRASANAALLNMYTILGFRLPFGNSVNYGTDNPGQAFALTTTW